MEADIGLVTDRPQQILDDVKGQGLTENGSGGIVTSETSLAHARPSFHSPCQSHLL